ncbi:MAG: ABC transporter permease [Planctomycetes bacterium]|nr:ABC transporter permease [Planctomycetota bacterium]
MSRPRPPEGLAAVRVAARTCVAGAPRGRRRIGLLALVFLPALVTALVLILGESGRGTGFKNFATILGVAYLGRILPLAMIFLGTATFGDEWAGGTACYVLGQPLSRRALVVGRWLACVRRALVLVLPAVATVYLLCLLPFGDAWQVYLGALGWTLAVLSLLTCAYAAVFLFFGLAFARAVMWSMVYVFISEMVLSQLPQSLAMLSLDFHARNLLWQLSAQEVFKPRGLTLGSDVIVEPVSIGVSLLWIACFTVGALALSALVLSRKEAGGEVQAAASGEA